MGRKTYEVIDINTEKGKLVLKARIRMQKAGDSAIFLITIPAEFGKKYAGKWVKATIEVIENENK